MPEIKEKLFAYISEKYHAAPEYPRVRYPGHTVFRQSDSQKLFALVADVPENRLGLIGEDIVEVLNVKVSDPFLADLLTQQEGFFRGYPMRQNSWIAIILDGTVPFEEVCHWLDESYLATASRETRYRLRPPKEWLVPANPKYYDVQAAFDEADEIDWKQGKGIKTGDTVFLYVAAPVSAILYKCLVTETNIPFHFDNGEVRMSGIMKIRLQKRYSPHQFTFDILGKKYGIFAVRGPRGIPKSLSEALKI